MVNDFGKDFLDATTQTATLLRSIPPVRFPYEDHDASWSSLWLQLYHKVTKVMLSYTHTARDPKFERLYRSGELWFDPATFSWVLNVPVTSRGMASVYYDCIYQRVKVISPHPGFVVDKAVIASEVDWLQTTVTSPVSRSQMLLWELLLDRINKLATANPAFITYQVKTADVESFSHAPQ